MASCVLAVDAGTTGVRTRAVFADGRPAVTSYRELTQHFPRPGWVEHDAVEIWQAVRDTLLAVVEQVGVDDVAAIGITNQRETVVAWDRATGRPHARAIVWQDRRTAARCDELAADGALDLVRARTGLVLDPYFSGTKFEWLLREGGVAVDDDLALGTVDAWVIWNLTGGEVFATDTTNASRTMLFDIERLAWDEELLRAVRRAAGQPAGGGRVERAHRRHQRPCRRARRHPGERDRRRPAGGAVRPGVRPARHGQEHLRDGQLRAAQRRTDVPAADRGPADDRGVDVRRRHGGLRPGGGDLRHRRGHPVAARRPRGDRRRRRRRAAGRVRRRHRRRRDGAGLRRAGRTVVGPVRPWHGRRHHAWHDAGPPRQGGRRGDGVPDARRRRGDGPGVRHAAHRAARRRRRVGDGRHAAVAGRPARRHGPPAPRPGDDGAGCGVPGRPRRRRLARPRGRRPAVGARRRVHPEPRPRRVRRRPRHVAPRRRAFAAWATG